MTEHALPSFLELLQPVEREALRERGRRNTYSDGEMIYGRGDAIAGLDVVILGGVKLVRQLDDGRQIVLATIAPGQQFGDNNAVRKRHRSHHAISVGDTVVDHYPQDVFVQLLDNPAIVRALYMVTAARLNWALEMVDDLRSLSPEARLVKQLAMMRVSAGGNTRLACLQDDLAGLLGVSSVTLAKALKTLKGRGLIETGYRAITICDVARFDALLAEIETA